MILLATDLQKQIDSPNIFIDGAGARRNITGADLRE